ncbi:IS110 family transposase [Cuniculiplasma divulgatum]|uniref:IS110 family transposase n=1 Tax=Cuniculiplasma divulgatum TaxID=1673428 RepID=UPI0011E60526|nr:IS110 family transposase [Cuniculiplasma divulgatum]
MYSIAMDVGKYKTYGIIDKDGEIVKEGCVLTSREEFSRFLESISEATIIVEASPTIDELVSFLPATRSKWPIH